MMDNTGYLNKKLRQSNVFYFLLQKSAIISFKMGHNIKFVVIIENYSLNYLKCLHNLFHREKLDRRVPLVVSAEAYKQVAGAWD